MRLSGRDGPNEVQLAVMLGFQYDGCKWTMLDSKMVQRWCCMREVV
jgi:hypothetical protein